MPAEAEARAEGRVPTASGGAWGLELGGLTPGSRPPARGKMVKTAMQARTAAPRATQRRMAACQAGGVDPPGRGVGGQGTEVEAEAEQDPPAMPPPTPFRPRLLN